MTEQRSIVFTFNKLINIIVDLSCPLSEIHCCCRVNIFLLSGENKYLLSCDTLRESMYLLSCLLKKALSNKLFLHKSIEFGGALKKDIGYLYNEYNQQLWNEYIKNRPGLMFENNDDGDRAWVGYKYNLWCHDFQSWIYNGPNGNIVFELTPLYTTNYIDKEYDHAILYEKWIQNYQPFLITVIPREVAEQWLDQANDILETIENNVKKLIDNGRF